MNLIYTLTTPHHYFYGKCLKTTNENWNLKGKGFKGKNCMIKLNYTTVSLSGGSSSEVSCISTILEVFFFLRQHNAKGIVAPINRYMADTENAGT